jgi:hypothetical protein
VHTTQDLAREAQWTFGMVVWQTASPRKRFHGKMPNMPKLQGSDSSAPDRVAHLLASHRLLPLSLPAMLENLYWVWKRGIQSARPFNFLFFDTS